jgi:hypothetical protein
MAAAAWPDRTDIVGVGHTAHGVGISQSSVATWGFRDGYSHNRHLYRNTGAALWDLGPG